MRLFQNLSWFIQMIRKVIMCDLFDSHDYRTAVHKFETNEAGDKIGWHPCRRLGCDWERAQLYQQEILKKKHLTLIK